MVPAILPSVSRVGGGGGGGGNDDKNEELSRSALKLQLRRVCSEAASFDVFVTILRFDKCKTPFVLNIDYYILSTFYVASVLN